MRARIVKENINDLFVPKSKEDIIKDLSNLSQEDKGEKLLIAALYNQLIEVKLLIETDADVNYENKKGFNPLLYACVSGHLEIAKYLIENGANVNAKTRRGETALMWASSNNHLDIIKLLIEKGADINTENENGFTALTYTKKDYKETVNLLKKYGAK
jgi:serine/threonine-protein phosphatase 6 regulatory ankyrin repeat subunit B